MRARARAAGMASFSLPILAFAAVAPSGEPPATVAAPFVEECAVEPLSLPERAAQTIMMGIPGQSLGKGAADLVARHAGAVVIQSYNVRDATQVAELTRALHETGRRRLLIAVDEEGGRVSRLGAKSVITELPSARELAASRSTDEVRQMAGALGAELRELGIDWNLAPVLDVTDAPAGTVVGDRSFSADPETATAYAAAFVEGLAEAGILTTGKHFPGHGATATDSHETLPTVEAPREELEEHLLPYVRLRFELDSIMTAHVLFTSLDGRWPASVSPSAVRLLREEIGYQGLVITDALEMDAISERWSIPEAAELAIRAGSDMVLVGPWREVAATARRLVRAVRRGTVPADRLDEAVGRVLTLKGYPSSTVGCLLA
jgi:beta-N-acetylhexosaminidase